MKITTEAMHRLYASELPGNTQYADYMAALRSVNGVTPELIDHESKRIESLAKKRTDITRLYD